MLLAAIPTLDELAADPACAELLPVEARVKLAMKAAGVLAALQMASAVRPGKVDSGDTLLDVEQVGAMIGMSGSWVEKHVRALPARVSVEGSPRWRTADIRAWVKNRPAYGSLRDVSKRRRVAE